MSTLAYTLVLLCVSLTLVSALPTARRFDRDDVLSGGDFLSVFMRRGDRLRTRHRAQGPFEHGQDHDRELNSVSAKTTLLDLVKPFPDKYTITDIYKNSKYGYEVNEMPNDQGDYQTNVPTHENEVKTTTQYTEPTTEEDIPTTVPYTFERIHKLPTQEQTTIPILDETVTQVELTTSKVETEKIEEKVIEVRVSSSVARHSHRAVETSTTKTISEVVPRAKLVDDNLVSTLVTQEQPKIQLIQRSDFAVEEAPLLRAEAASHQEQRDQRSFSRQDEVAGKVQEVTRYGVEQPRGLHRKLPVFELHFHNPPAALVSSYEGKPDAQRSEDHQPQTFKRKEFRQLSHYGRHSEPISYHSRVSSPTSDSSINFYREHHNNRAVAETVQQPVISEPYAPTAYEQSQDQPKEDIPPSGEQQRQESSTYHEEPSERVYGEAEKVYGQPEQNYEVDEAVSVITNGKAHGIQGPTAPPTQSQDQANQNKFGYVVEGRNFRKYRVEERTNDGFIVGEYGVVSHDDGSLRGVRYTADSNINPRLIYDTLVKFLSL